MASSSGNNVLIILGYPANNEGEPGPILKSRLDKGVELFNAGGFDKMIVTGAAVYNNYVEAQVMAAYCIKKGVNADDIIMEPRARNTFENARMARDIMRRNGYSYATVVTSSFHEIRARYFFSKHIEHIKLVTAPFPEKFPFAKRLIYSAKEYIILMLFNLGLLNNRYAHQ